jgi:hypothetical protein
MIKRVTLTGLALATAAVLAGAGPAAAATTDSSDATPGYQCVLLLNPEGSVWIGQAGCRPSNGAPHFGPIQGSFTITGRAEGGDKTVTCTPPSGGEISGFAEGTVRVFGRNCA